MRRRPTSVAKAVTQFAVTGFAVVLLIGIGSTLVLRQTGRSEAIRDARVLTQVDGRGIVEPVLEPGIVAGDRRALARLDGTIRQRVLRDPVVRVKLWTPDGRIVYSDEPRLIGLRYPLRQDEQKALAEGRVQAEVADLSRPENRLEQAQGKLLEVYLPVRVRGGQKLLFEQYLRYSSVSASGRKIWLAFLPALVAGLVILALVQVPLAWSMARRLREGQLERESLLTKAIESSTVERRRIAGDLHDGLVQELAGLAYSLSAAADRVPDTADNGVGQTLRDGATTARQSMRSLRSLLVEIYPPSLQRAGLEAALADVLAPAAARGIDTRLDIPAGLQLIPEVEALLFRTAQEGLRNVIRHADATHVDVSVQQVDHRVALVVSDDGRGLESDASGSRPAGGHFGLQLLADLAESASGTLAVDSRPGGGTTLKLEVPLP